MKIKTSRGQEIDAYGASAMTMRGGARLVISLGGDTPLAEAAQALDGLEWISAQNDAAAGVTTTYEGYSRISTIARAEDGAVRVTLTREG